MPVYRIAELNIRIDPVTPQTEKRIAPYLCGSEEYDFDASVTADEIDNYMKKSKTPCLPYLAEDALVLTNISKTVLSSYDGCFFQILSTDNTRRIAYGDIKHNLMDLFGNE